MENRGFPSVASRSFPEGLAVFDSHCHLDFEELGPALDEHLERARALGVRGWFVPGTRPEQWRALESLRSRDGVWLGVGLHPWETEHPWDIDALMVELGEHARNLCAVALGECGVDKFRGASIERQSELFEAQLKVASELDLPVVLHQVGHQKEFLRSLDRVGVPRSGGVVHGFSGDAAFGRALIRRGLLLGVGAGATYESRKKLREVLTEVPLGHLVLETDAPDQKPRGGGLFGVPADLGAVCEAVAQWSGNSPELVSEVTERTARALYRLPVA